MKHDFKAKDSEIQKRYFRVGKNTETECCAPTEATHTPINYKNEYHRLLEEKEKNEGFFRDQLYSRGCAIGFLTVSVFLFLEVGYALLF